jgi:hypothetical protein
MAGQLPDDIVQSIAISNAKSISEQPEMLSNLAESSTAVSDGHVRLADLELHINGEGQLVVAPMSSRVRDIFVPGSYSRENVEVMLDTSRGVTLRLRKDR